jgi:hypothetical protein
MQSQLRAIEFFAGSPLLLKPSITSPAPAGLQNQYAARLQGIRSKLEAV